MGDGARLHIACNLGDAAVSMPKPAGDLLFGRYDEAGIPRFMTCCWLDRSE
jgi:hypothetical protein